MDRADWKGSDDAIDDRPGSGAKPMTAHHSARISAAEWHSRLRHRPASPADASTLFGIRRLVGTPPLVSQPALSDDIVCMHLGGGKRVHRWHAGKASVHDVADRSITIMPRAIENRWRTVGTIDYLHIVLSRDQLETVAADEHRGDPAQIALRDVVGTRHPLIEASLAEMYRLARDGDKKPGRLHCDSLLTVFTAALLAHASSAADTLPAGQAAPQRGGLGGWRMRRVIDYMESHFASDIELAELTALTGLSRAHFYRAFRQSTGTTPARHLDAIRAERARAMLAGATPLAEIAAAVGSSGAGLATIFRRHFGISPRDYRRSLR